MKYFLVSLFVLFLSLDIYPQLVPDFYPDTVISPPVQEPRVKVASINLEGNLHELVIAVGIPGNSATTNYPVLVNDSTYPVYGVNEQGTLLSTLITQNGGSLPVDQWFGPALNKYFNTLSGDVYTVDFDFLKPATGRYQTTTTWSGFVSLNGGNDVSLVYNQHQMIFNEVCQNIYNIDPHAFDNIDCIHFTFEGISGTQLFYLGGPHGGTVFYNVTIQGTDGTIYYSNKPVTIQCKTDAIGHERLHIIGAISGSPSGFKGFRDRGFDVGTGNDHHNMFFSYDAMYHNAAFLNLHSLYGATPLLTHELIFLGWIKPEEILVVNENNFSPNDLLKLADVNYPLTAQQLADGYKRIIKVMVKENFNGDKDEYFLIENHQATEYDKAFSNYDEYQTKGYNKGILVWHVKELTNMLNVANDNYIDLEVAVPYDDWYGNPIVPPLPFPADYNRPHNVMGQDRWNDNWAEDYDYQDDNYMYGSGNNWYYVYPPDGGRHIWEITVPPPHPWYPPDPNYFHRLESMSSDFFTDEEIRGHITDRMTDATRPSTKTWGGVYISGFTPSEKTHIAIKNIKRETGYMSLQVLYNYWEGEVTADATMTGQVTIGNNLTVPAGVTLTIEGGTKISFDDDYTNGPVHSQLIVNGTLKIIGGESALASNGYLALEPGSRVEFSASSQLTINGVLRAVGTSSNKIIFDKRAEDITGGTLYFSGLAASNSVLDYVEINNGGGIKCLNGANIVVQNSLIYNCTNGIYIYGAAPSIINNDITDPYGYGIYGETLGYDPLIKGNTIIKSSNKYNNNGIYFTNNDAATHICGNDIQGFSTGLYFTGGGQIYFWDHNYVTPFPNNRFGDNAIGLTSAYGSFIGGGISSTWGCYNSMVNNTSYDASAHHNGQMNAQYNWWGIDGAQLSTGNGGIINASNPLNYDPWGSQKDNMSLNKEPFNPEGGDDITQAITLEQQGRIAELIDLCKQMIQENGNTNFAISELIHVKIKHHIKNIRDYLDSLTIGNRPFKAKLLYYLAGLSLSEGKYNIAMYLYNKIINEFPTNREAVDALFEKFFAVLNIAENREQAGQILTELQSLELNDDDFLMKLEMAECLYNGESGAHMSKPSGTEEINEVKKYELSDNFPNPFNPTTTINYQLPQTGFVTLKVYDILGKEVATLVNDQKIQGKYTVDFDASELASGVYIYQIRANDYVSSKKMLLLK